MFTQNKKKRWLASTIDHKTPAPLKYIKTLIVGNKKIIQVAKISDRIEIR